MKPTHILRFDMFELAQGLQLRDEDVLELFTDGRRSSWVMERRIARAEGWTPAMEGAEYDLVDPLFRKWEVRSLSRRGTHFCPSSMIGTGREFTVSGFLQRLCFLDGYVIADVTKFPDVPYWIVPRHVVQVWWVGGHLGINTKVARKKMVEMLDNLPPQQIMNYASQTTKT